MGYSECFEPTNIQYGGVFNIRILVAGGAGVLGSTLTKLFLNMGFSVQVVDICRKEEAWRIFDHLSQVKYYWKSQNDLSRRDLENIDVVFDCAIGYADRLYGTESPMTTTLSNVLPSLNILEQVRKIEKRPVIVYPSSFNAPYGHNEGPISEATLPFPTSIYGWTKASVELLYLTYYFSFDIPIVITRTASSFGPGGRSDELPHKLIFSMINNMERFYLRSPESKRLWTFAGDVITFYKSFIERVPSMRE